MASFWALPSFAAMGTPCLFVAPPAAASLDSGTSPEEDGGGLPRSEAELLAAAPASKRFSEPDSGLLWGGLGGADDEEGRGLFDAAAFAPGLLAVEEEPTIKAIEASSLFNTGVAAASSSPTASGGPDLEPSNL